MCVLTDGASYDFGRGDLGLKGMQMFFKSHKCNYLCKKLGLRDIGEFKEPTLRCYLPGSTNILGGLHGKEGHVVKEIRQKSGVSRVLLPREAYSEWMTVNIYATSVSQANRAIALIKDKVDELTRRPLRRPSFPVGRSRPFPMARVSRGFGLLALGFGCAFVGVAPGAGAPGAAPRERSLRSLVQRQADASMLQPYGPVVAYAKALMNAAADKKEIVMVTDDVLAIKEKFKNREWLEQLLLVQSNPAFTSVEKARETVKLLKPLKSSVMPKFIVFLAKKHRLNGLKCIVLEYMQSMYFNQSITPVTVRSAQRLTEQQKDQIKEKMKQKAGTRDIKLITEIEPTLIGGLQLEWGYTDPEGRYAPTHGIDLSLKNILSKKALEKGRLCLINADTPKDVRSCYEGGGGNAAYWRSKRVEWIDKSGGAQIALYRGGWMSEPQPEEGMVNRIYIFPKMVEAGKGQMGASNRERDLAESLIRMDVLGESAAQQEKKSLDGEELAKSIQEFVRKSGGQCRLSAVLTQFSKEFPDKSQIGVNRFKTFVLNFRHLLSFQDDKVTLPAAAPAIPEPQLRQENRLDDVTSVRALDWLGGTRWKEGDYHAEYLVQFQSPNRAGAFTVTKRTQTRAAYGVALHWDDKMKRVWYGEKWKWYLSNLTEDSMYWADRQGNTAYVWHRIKESAKAKARSEKAASAGRGWARRKVDLGTARA
ncbi:unnamed protein product [Effrenium voratum]|uniref:Alpha-type protein kinase domain-containing protein n=1 Tax=Effrenium voratum TaxID=2562239 RepID=A0AA36ILR1_9DINO|nr:unnamed protein product [Effrenium voratum]